MIAKWLEEHGGSVLFHFTVLQKGWEMDNDGWVIQADDGERYVVLTSHGLKYRASEGDFYNEFAIHAKAYEGFMKAKKLLEEKE